MIIINYSIIQGYLTFSMAGTANERICEHLADPCCDHSKGVSYWFIPGTVEHLLEQ